VPACQEDPLAEGEDEDRLGLPSEPTGKPTELAREETLVLETVQAWTSRVCDAQPDIAKASG